MKVVMLSGGSGKRLWPLTNDARSKQFLKVLTDNDGYEVSMVQRVWSQLQSVGLSRSTVISTSRAQVEMLQSQLGHEVPLIVEPDRRDTFPAIALAATYLYSTEGVDLDEVVVVLPVDPFVENEFFSVVSQLEEVLISSRASLALIGVRPTFPSEKYGYIVPEDQTNDQQAFMKVSHFREKPTVKQAEELINHKALWNCGVFAFKLKHMITILIEKGLPTQYGALLKRYNELPKISFDYEVVEKMDDVVVLPFEGSWKDLGTWNTLTEEMGNNLIGKGIISVDSFDSHLVNELDIPVVILGLSNVVVAASPDGILVSDKDASHRVKEVIDFNQRPMYEERHWGWYKVLDYTKFSNGDEVMTRRIGITAGKNLSYQFHYKRHEVWTVISGTAQFVLDGHFRQVQSGDVLQIPAGAKHSIKAITALEMIEIQTGTELIEDDILRICISWEEVEELCGLGGRL